MLRERLDHVIGAERGRLIIGSAHAEKGRLARQRQSAGFGLHHAAGILGIFFERVKVNAPHGVLHVKLILKTVGDRFRVADDEQVIRHNIRINRAGAGAQPRQEFVLGFAGAIAIRADVFVVTRAGLLLAMGQQFAQRFLDGRVGVVRHDDAPAGLRQVLRVHALLDGPMRLASLLEFIQQPFVNFFPGDDRGEVIRRHRRQIVIAGRSVDAVKVKFIGHGFSPPIMPTAA